MRTTQDFGHTPQYEGMPHDVAGGDPRGTGWVLFSAVMLGVLGIWNIFEGIAAIGTANVYVASAHYVFSDLKTWGWIVLILGVLQLVAAMSLFRGGEWSRWFGVAVASVNAIGQLLFMPAYPLWGIAMFGVDILIIYGLVAYAGKQLRV
jgi:hypothetical protein